jgi:hypothetical protein
MHDDIPLKPARGLFNPVTLKHKAVHDNPLDHADSSIVVTAITAIFVHCLAINSGRAAVRICHKSGSSLQPVLPLALCAQAKQAIEH